MAESEVSSPNLIEKAVQVLVPQPCFDRYFLDFDFLDGHCAKVVISKGLGFGIILGAVLVKLPQIIKMTSARSAEGISFLSVLLELVATSANLSYSYQKSFPFSAYGEGLFLCIQTGLIGALVLLYGGNGLGAFVYSLSYTAVMGYLLSPFVPMQILTSLQSANITLVIISKLIQIIANFRNGSTGQLSAITVFLLFAGSVARIFTSIQETGDSLVILTFVVSTVFNGLIAAQVMYYWNVKKAKTE